MRTRLLILPMLALLGGVAFAAFGSGCGGVIVRPAVVSTGVVVAPAPARVYHNGMWLHYRTDGYYYHHGGHWVVATSVPVHVAHYHRVSRPHHRTYVRSRHYTRSRHHSGTRHYTRRRYHKPDVYSFKSDV